MVKEQAKPVEKISAIEATFAQEEARNVARNPDLPLASDSSLKPIGYCIENLVHPEGEVPTIDPGKERLVLVVCPPCAEEKYRIHKRKQAEKKEMDIEQPELPFE